MVICHLPLSAPVVRVNEFFDSNRLSRGLVEVISKNTGSSIQPCPVKSKEVQPWIQYRRERVSSYKYPMII
jgi:hypothetical protein